MSARNAALERQAVHERQAILETDIVIETGSTVKYRQEHNKDSQTKRDRKYSRGR